MADWRTRNFVPDSEDEADGFDDDSHSLSIPAAAAAGGNFLDIDDILNSRDDSSDGSSSVDLLSPPELLKGSGSPERKTTQEATWTTHAPQDRHKSKIELHTPSLSGENAELDRNQESSRLSSKRPAHWSPSSSHVFKRRRAGSASPRDANPTLPSDQGLPGRNESSVARNINFQPHVAPSSALLSPRSSLLTEIPSSQATPLSLTTSGAYSRDLEPSPSLHAPQSDVRATLAYSAPVQGTHSQNEGIDDHATRRFRPRKAIQQHPYTLESERFKKTAMSHGMKGIRYVETIEAHPAEDGERSDAESHYSESDGSTSDLPVLAAEEHAVSLHPSDKTRLRPESTQPRSPIDVKSSSPVKPRSPLVKESRRRIHGDRSEGPLNGKAVESGAIRHDVALACVHPSPGAQQESTDDPCLTSLTVERLETSPLRSLSSADPLIFVDNDLSMPEEEPAGHYVMSRHDGGIESSPSRTCGTPSEDVLQVNERERENSPIPLTNSAFVPYNVSTSDSEPETQISRVRRDIKGVLPASWLRLDQRKQRPAPARLRDGGTKKPIDGSARGTARPLHPHRQAVDREAIPILLSSDSDASNPAGERRTPVGSLPPLSTKDSSSVRQRQSEISSWFDQDESMEDNEIDRMAPTRPKKATYHRPRRRGRQTTMTEARYGYQEHVLPERINQKREGESSARQSRQQLSQSTRARAKNAQAEQHRVKPLLQAAQNLTPQNRPVRIAARTALARALSTHRGNVRRPVRKLPRSRHQAASETRGPTVGNSFEQRITERMFPNDLVRHPLGPVDGNRQAWPKPHRGRNNVKSDLEKLDAGHSVSDSSHLVDGIEHGPRGVGLTSHTNGRLLGTLEPSTVAPARLETLRAKKSRKTPSHTVSASSVQRVVQPLDSSRFNTDTLRNPFTIPNARTRKRNKTALRCEEPGIRFTTPCHPEGAASSCLTVPSDVERSQLCLSGLNGYGTEYSVSFGVEPLPSGWCFDAASLLGSGLVSRCLHNAEPQNVGIPLHVASGSSSCMWSVWNETVATELDWLFNQTTSVFLHSSRTDDGLGDRPTHYPHLTMILRYVTDHLSFSDATGHISLLRRVHQHLENLTAQSQSALQSQARQLDAKKLPSMFIVPVLVQALLLALRCSRLADDLRLTSDQEVQFQPLIEKLCTQTLSAIFRDDYHDLKVFARQPSASTGSSSTLCRTKAEALVITLHVIESLGEQAMPLWSRLAEAQIFTKPGPNADVKALDRQWEAFFSVLPLLDVDEHGMVGDHRRSTDQRQNWHHIIQLLEPVLDVYHANGRRQGATFNGYVRSIFRRCFCLIDVWGWLNCAPIVKTIFDFFAQTKLAFLHFEESSGPFPLSEKLDAVSHRDLTVTPSDRSFHIFLKILWLGLRSKRSLSSAKDLSNLACRLTPNHARRITKDKEARCSDLEALRNHHELLVVLCRFVRPDHKKWIHLIENLVDFADSHREACRINAKSWLSLMTFQLSCVGEPAANTRLLTDWMNRMLTQTVSLHKHARVEVEDHARHNRGKTNFFISLSSQEAVIASNQTQLEGLLIEMLGFTRQTLAKAPSSLALSSALPTCLADVLGMSDRHHSRINAVLEGALDAIIQYAERAERLHRATESQSSIESLQDDDAPPAQGSDEFAVLPECIAQALYGFLTNTVGSNALISEPFALKTIQAWTATVCLSKCADSNNCAPYLGPSGQFSWSRLRNTEQVRKLTPYYYAELIQRDAAFYAANKLTVLKALLESLVERPALLKYQNMLVAAVLNRDPENRLLRNVPFMKVPGTGRFFVTESGLREHRMSLITCIISSMRESLGESTANSLVGQKSNYVELLRHTVSAMKGTYESLGGAPNESNEYVSFVHAVAELLEHQAAGIFKMDKTFLGREVLPFAGLDPDRVVGTLRRYGLHLQSLGGRKQLAAFIQSTLSRAALHGCQTELAQLFRLGIVKSMEGRRLDRESLPFVILHDFCAAYITATASTTCGWLLASPLIKAVPAVLDAWTVSLDATDETALDIVESTIVNLLQCVKYLFSKAIESAAFATNRSYIRTSTGCLTIIATALRPLDYVLRFKTDPWPLAALVNELVELECNLTRIMRSSLDRPAAPSIQKRPDLRITTEPQVQGIFASTLHEIRKELGNDWRSRSGEEIEIRDNKGIWQPVPSDLGTMEDECQLLASEANRFRAAARAMPAFCRAHSDDDDDDEIW